MSEDKNYTMNDFVNELNRNINDVNLVIIEKLKKEGILKINKYEGKGDYWYANEACCLKLEYEETGCACCNCYETKLYITSPLEEEKLKKEIQI